METIDATEQPGRPWARAIGLFLLGLAVAGVSNAPGMQGDPGPTLRAVGTAGYLVGIVVSGLGLHWMLWSPRSARTRGVRLVVTALLAFPAFLVGGVVLSLLFTIIQLRSPF